MCAVHCVQLLHTILHRTDLIIFPLALQTITISESTLQLCFDGYCRCTGIKERNAPFLQRAMVYEDGMTPVGDFQWLGQFGWALVSPDGVAPSRMVPVSASVNLPLHHKVRKYSSGTGSPRWSRCHGPKFPAVLSFPHRLSSVRDF